MKWVELAVHVLAEVYTAGRQMWKDLLECHDLLMSHVATVVHHDVEVRDFALESPPEVAVALVADEDFYRRSLVDPAGVLDVHAVDETVRSEVVLPHPEAAAAVDADFQDAYRAPDELGEMV